MPRTILALSAAALLAACHSPPLLYEGRDHRMVEPLEVRLVRITDDGLVPAAPLRLQHEDGIAFLNEGREVASVIFPGEALPQLRCSYTVGFEGDERGTYTPHPLAPGDAASICLHSVGRIPFEVHRPGLPVLRSEVILEEHDE